MEAVNRVTPDAGRATIPEMPAMTLRDYYDELDGSTEEPMTAFAEAMAADPSPLVSSFLASVAETQTRAARLEPFHDGQRTTPPMVPVTEIAKTIQFAGQIADGERRPVDGQSNLACRYVDRELFALRTTGPDRVAKRTLDLLLAAEDELPIVCELKIRGDRITYFALVQALMHAADLLSPSQRDRLQRLDDRFRWPDGGPYLDVWILTFDPPSVGAYRGRSAEAAKTISRRLMRDPQIKAFIRRIAFVEARVSTSSLQLHEEACFE